jgi:hypothetical protein
MFIFGEGLLIISESGRLGCCLSQLLDSPTCFISAFFNRIVHQNADIGLGIYEVESRFVIDYDSDGGRLAATRAATGA